MGDAKNSEIYLGDGLNRKEFVNKIIQFIDSFSNAENGITSLLSGQFGSGKSTVFTYLKKELQSNENFQVVEYNTWENNFLDNPLFPLLNSLNGLKSHDTKMDIKEGAIDIFKKIPKMGLATLENITGVAVNCLLDDNKIFTQFEDYKNAINTYREILKNACKKTKTVLLVDELDRCLPAYQIKVLETMHHLLGIQNLVVIIAIDKTQLEKTIKTQFGTTNTYGYLAKFIDYEFELPHIGDPEFLYSNIDMPTHAFRKNMFIPMYKKAKITVREGLKIIERLNLINDKLNKDTYDDCNPLFINLLLLIKQKEPTVYKKWFLDKEKLHDKKSAWCAPRNERFFLWMSFYYCISF